MGRLTVAEDDDEYVVMIVRYLLTCDDLSCYLQSATSSHRPGRLPFQF